MMGAQLSDAGEARLWAQRLAFGPLVFHAALALRDTGILQLLMDAGDVGLDADVVRERVGLSDYAVTVLLESGVGSGLVSLAEGKYGLTKAGYFVLHDEMTRANMNFVRDICYEGAPELLASLRGGKPEGLKTLGPWANVYQGLGELTEPARTSWFTFDHYYSDSAFSAALPHVFAKPRRSLLDVGGNTGKWARLCLRYDPAVHVTILDLPSQLDVARQLDPSGEFSERLRFHEIDLLDLDAAFPPNQETVWLSQLLSCFSVGEVTDILRRARLALEPDGEVFILETLIDRQRHAGASFALRQTSLYFACIANATSRIYDTPALVACIERAGLSVIEIVDGLGTSHSLLRCKAM